MLITLKGERILVTGGGSGLGLAMCNGFAESGADLIICGRTLDKLLVARDALIKRYDIKCDTYICDIRDRVAVRNMINEVYRTAPISVLVNNAAASFIAKTEELSPNAADAILAPTLHGTLYCTLEIGKKWIKEKSPGTILNILSTSVVNGRPFTVPSAMGKAAIAVLTKSLAVEWAHYKIRSIGLAPGPFHTDGSAERLDPLRKRENEIIKFNPMHRYGNIDELAALATFLVSKKSEYINGEIINIDGGAHLRTSGAEDLLNWTESEWNAIKRK